MAPHVSTFLDSRPAAASVVRLRRAVSSLVALASLGAGCGGGSSGVGVIDVDAAREKQVAKGQRDYAVQPPTPEELKKKAAALKSAARQGQVPAPK
jgi:hypothetical protein